MKRNNWSDHENRVIIDAYYRLMKAQDAGKPLNKAQLARETLPLLNNRSKGSYEAKLMNVSAAMVSIGLPYVQGYLPLGHAQASLVALVKHSFVWGAIAA
jgi:hypothetical protein